MKIRRSLIILVLAALAAVPLKFIQLSLIDYSTGFYQNGHYTAVFLPLICALSTLLMAVISFTSKEYPYASPNTRSVPMGLVCLAVAVGVGYSSARELFDSETARFSGTIGLVYSCIGLLSVLAFFFLAIGFFKRGNLIEQTPLIMIVPVVWIGLRMTLTFLEFTRISAVAEYMYDIVALITMLLFILSSAKFMSGARGKTAKWVFAAGGPAALFSALMTFPRIALDYAASEKLVELNGGYEEYLSNAFKGNIVDLFLMLFTVGFMLHISKRVRRETAEQEYMQDTSFLSSHVEEAVPSPSAQTYRAAQAAASVQRQQIQMSPKAQAVQRQLQGLLPGGGVDEYTARGAGLKVADQFEMVRGGDGNRYGGLGAFSEDIIGGDKALDILESSSGRDLPGFMNVISFDDSEGDEQPRGKAGDEWTRYNSSDEGKEMERKLDKALNDMSSMLNDGGKPIIADLKYGDDEGTPEEQAHNTEADSIPIPSAPAQPETREVNRASGSLSDKLSFLEKSRAAARENSKQRQQQSMPVQQSMPIQQPIENAPVNPNVAYQQNPYWQSAAVAAPAAPVYYDEYGNPISLSGYYDEYGNPLDAGAAYYPNPAAMQSGYARQPYYPQPYQQGRYPQQNGYAQPEYGRSVSADDYDHELYDYEEDEDDEDDDEDYDEDDRYSDYD